jgi:hypothetical protein
VTPQHAGRLVRGEQRPVIAGLDAEAVQDSVCGSIDAFLADVELGPGDEVLAATARALGAKLDACSVSDSASAAQAVPRLASQLVNVLELLGRGAVREPDALDLLRQRRRARLMTQSAGTNGQAHPPTK